LRHCQLGSWGAGADARVKGFPHFFFFFDVSFPSIIFVLSRFGVFLSDGSSKIPQKTFYKKLVSKSFQTDLFLGFIYHVFGRVSVRGVQKHGEKDIQKN
jgi:hypothetical protein